MERVPPLAPQPGRRRERANDAEYIIVQPPVRRQDPVHVRIRTVVAERLAVQIRDPSPRLLDEERARTHVPLALRAAAQEDIALARRDLRELVGRAPRRPYPPPAVERVELARRDLAPRRQEHGLVLDGPRADREPARRAGPQLRLERRGPRASAADRPVDLRGRGIVD